MVRNDDYAYITEDVSCGEETGPLVVCTVFACSSRAIFVFFSYYVFVEFWWRVKEKCFALAFLSFERCRFGTWNKTI